MPPKFAPGAKAYDKDGRSYVVEVVDGGTVYCTASNGIETEFPEDGLFSETEWAARGDGRRDISYTRMKQSRFYLTNVKLDKSAAEQMLSKADKLSPGLLDFAAFMTALQVLRENKDDGMADALSIKKSREIFDEAKPEARASILANLVGARPEALVDAGKMGGDLLKAMLEKGLATHGDAYEDFQDRPRR